MSTVGAGSTGASKCVILASSRSLTFWSDGSAGWQPSLTTRSLSSSAGVAL
jgi:hypothetical protein